MTYTQATGKRPMGRRDGRWIWLAYPIFDLNHELFVLPDPLYFRMGVRPEFETEAAALEAADRAAERAVAEGAMGPIEGVA